MNNAIILLELNMKFQTYEFAMGQIKFRGFNKITQWCEVQRVSTPTKSSKEYRGWEKIVRANAKKFH